MSQPPNRSDRIQASTSHSRAYKASDRAAAKQDTHSVYKACVETVYRTSAENISVKIVGSGVIDATSVHDPRRSRYNTTARGGGSSPRSREPPGNELLPVRRVGFRAASSLPLSVSLLNTLCCYCWRDVFFASLLNFHGNSKHRVRAFVYECVNDMFFFIL